MIKKQKLKLYQLVKEMWRETTNYGCTVQRDTIKDIISLLEMQEYAFRNNDMPFEYYWGVMFTGTTLMLGNNDFGIWEGSIESRYRIMWSKKFGWSIEEI